MRDWGLRLEGRTATANLWAPSARRVELLLADGRRVPLTQAEDGWHTATLDDLRPGDRDLFVVDGSEVPDPAARAQAEGATGWSALVALDDFDWASDWSGRPWRETVLYELHVGTFSEAGTFLGAIEHLDHLAELGVTMVELMPIGTFPGARNWGYDCVLPFAPHPAYGTPGDLQRLVDACHRRGLSIVLDVVYNHFGPAAAFLADYAPEFFTDRHKTPWGPAINFDGKHAAAVRDFYVQNALQWVRDYRFDGLRIDAVQAIKDDSQTPFLTELSQRVRAAVPGRLVHLTLENDLNEARWLVTADGYEAQWNDDFHHVMRVLLAGQTDGYYEDYAADPIGQLGRALTEGFSYQGQESRHRPGMFRGTPSGHLPATAFVNFLQNHDQVGNAPYGKRLSQLASIEAVRLGAAVLLLSPGIPMLFMGEEWAAGTPFDFFCDYQDPIAEAVRSGRREEFKRFEAFQSEAALAGLSDPVAAETFHHSALAWVEQTAPDHNAVLALHRELLALRAVAIVPLLDQIRPGTARFRAVADRAIEVNWPAGATTLVLAANFSAEPVEAAALAGQRLFALSADEKRLGAWGFRATLMATPST